MTAHARRPLAALSAAVRRLADAYRGAATWRQCAILTLPLIVFARASAPAVWIGTALLLAALFYLRLDLGLRLIILALPFAFSYKHFGADIYSPPEILTIACFIAWTTRAMRSLPRPSLGSPAACSGQSLAAPSAGRRGKTLLATLTRRCRPLDWAVLTFIATACISLFIAEDAGAARWELRILVIEPALVYLMARSNIGASAAQVPSSTQIAYKPGRLPLSLADALAAAGLITATVGLYQYFFTDYVESVQGVRRILSLFDSPNHVSLFLGRIAPVSFCLAAFGAARPGQRTNWRRIYHAAALLPILLCLYLTYSRGAWLLGLPAALVFIGVMRGRRGRIAMAVVLIGALLALIPILHTPRMVSLLTLESGTNYHRLLLWQGASRMIAANPILGVGLGNFMRHYPRHMLREAGHEPVVFHPHNLLLDTWTSMGLPGIAALTFVLAAFFRAGLRAYRRLHGERQLQALALGLLASMVSFGAHGLVDTGFRLTDLAFVFMLTLGMIAGMPPGSPRDDR